MNIIKLTKEEKEIIEKRIENYYQQAYDKIFFSKISGRMFTAKDEDENSYVLCIGSEDDFSNVKPVYAFCKDDMFKEMELYKDYHLSELGIDKNILQYYDEILENKKEYERQKEVFQNEVMNQCAFYKMKNCQNCFVGAEVKNKSTKNCLKACEEKIDKYLEQKLGFNKEGKKI